MAEQLKPGQTFAERYRIERFLAEGGYGAVYVAEQIATELRVALKVLWPQTLSSDDAVEKFKLEARVAGRVNSDHIVRVIDAGFDSEAKMPFLVMELLDGEDLAAVVERSGPLSPEVVVRFFRQIASALDKAHGFRDKDGQRAPIVHRDLKPENLFLTRREDGGAVVKILDFGIAKVLSSTTKVTQDIKGTPLYMAYEQAAGTSVSPQTDIWALGLIAFYLLSGKSYWKAAESPEGSMTQLFGEVLSLPLVPPSKRLAEYGSSVHPPVAFDAWFLRCVDREPTKRFATAGDVARALAAAFGVGDGPSSRAADSSAFASTVAAGPSQRSFTPAGRASSDAVDARSGDVALATATQLSAQTPPEDARSRTVASPGMGTSLVGLGSSQVVGRTERTARKSRRALFVIGGTTIVAGLAAVGFLLAGRQLPASGPRPAIDASGAALAPDAGTLVHSPEPPSVTPAAPTATASPSASAGPATAPSSVASTQAHAPSGRTTVGAPKPPAAPPPVPVKGSDPYRER